MRAVKLGSGVLRHDHTHQRLERDLLVTTITIAKTIEASGLTDSATIPDNDAGDRECDSANHAK
jgi:hypothetical protein